MNKKASQASKQDYTKNWKNRTLWTQDNLNVLRGMNSASVDLIYLDPPFNSNANYAAPIGSQAAGAEFRDTWGLNDINLAWHGIIKQEYPALYSLLSTVREVHSDSMMSYLIYMSIRIIEMRRILKDTGSIYLHCDPTASHYLKLLMDCVFGKGNYRNEIIWCYSTSGRAKKGGFAKKHDVVLFYSKTGKFNWPGYKIPISQKYLDSHYKQFDEKGKRCRIRTDHGKARIYYPEDGMTCNDWWEIPSLNSRAKERTGYPTQKPLAILKRIIRASCPLDGVMLDPFCGCATACIAAEIEQRQWVGIDISSKAYDLVKDRLEREVNIGEGRMFGSTIHRTDIPKRTDLGNYLKYNHPNNKKHLYGEQGGFCFGCENHFQIQNLTIDHIIPKTAGGTDHISNLQLLCGSCNSIKGRKTNEELIVRLTDKGYIKAKVA